MSTNEDFWVRTDWARDDLRDKSVRFELTTTDKKVSGVGVIRISQRPSGEQHIEIVVTTAPSHWERTDHIFTLRQHHAERIQRHPDRCVAEFQLLA